MNLLKAIYRFLLSALPSDFVRKFGDEMEITFGDMLREARVEGGTMGVARAFCSALLDLSGTLVREHYVDMKAKACINLAFFIVSVAAVLVVNKSSTEVQAPFLILITSSFLLGAINPKDSWKWAILLGSAVPMYDLLLACLHVIPYERGLFGEFATIIPTLIFGGAGAFGASAIRIAEGTSEKSFALLAASFGGGILVGFADFTLITPIPAIVGLVTCGIVIGSTSRRPARLAVALGTGVPVGITLLMAAHMHPTRHHFVFVDARSIVLCLATAMLVCTMRKSLARTEMDRDLA